MKTLSEKVVFKGKHFEVVHATVEVAKGETRVWEYVLRRDGTRTIAVDPELNVLLTREYRHELHAEDWRLPGGRLNDKDEPIEDAARREFEEETGFVADKWEYLWSSTLDSTVRYQRHFFLASDLRLGQSEPEEGTEITTHWTPMRQAYEMALRGDIKEEISALAIIKLFHRIKET